MDVLGIVSAVGVASIIGGFVYTGRKLQVLNDLVLTTNKIKTNVKVIGDYLITASDDFDHKELQAYSPLKLTPAGQKLIGDIGFDAVFNQHCQDFFDYIDGERPKLKYDVERASIKSVSALSNNDYMEFLKVYFYNNPDRNIANFAPTLGVYVRDKYLDAHPEIVN